MGFRLLIIVVSLFLCGCHETPITNPSANPSPNPGAAHASTPSQANPTKAHTPPAPPLRLPLPPPPPADPMSALSPEELVKTWTELHGQGDYPAAAIAGRWAVTKGADLRYNLACSLALSQQVDASLYFLQEAARLEGVDTELARQDPDLQLLRDDPRWSSVSAYLQEMSHHWATQPIHRVDLVVPKGYKPGRPIPVLIWLHGLGGGESVASYQEICDRLGVAVVGVSGTVPLGPKSFRWSEDLDRDGHRVSDGLRSLASRLTPAPGKTILFGFSQGAHLAFALSLEHPNLYRGAICLSPGWMGQTSAPRVQTANGQQRFVLVVGDGEHPGNVGLARQNADWARERKAQVRLEIIEGQSQHAFPSDFSARFGPWLSWVAATPD